MSDADGGLRFLAFYLPQYHVIPENEAWWGSGFTEWSNVRSAHPLFEGHQQPRVPDELGYYDLTNADVRARQALLAEQHGIDGFVYYHYWFHGRRLLERPVDEVLVSGEPGFPFCLCWANENWTRAWDGGADDVLVAESYSDEDDLAHARWLAAAFADPRYIRVDGRPLFLVYRAARLPDARRTTETWRRELSRLGVGDVYLARVENFPDERTDPAALGFDAAVEYQPDWMRPGATLMKPALDGGTVAVRDYGLSVALALTKPAASWKRFPCVSPGFDSTPRYGRRPVIYDGSTPALYARFVRGVMQRFQPFSAGENLVFVNAWNEWGESNYLEPDQQWGRGYLEAHQAARAADASYHALRREADAAMLAMVERLNDELEAARGRIQDAEKQVAAAFQERDQLRLNVAELQEQLGSLQQSRAVRLGAAVGAVDARVRSALRRSSRR